MPARLRAWLMSLLLLELGFAWTFGAVLLASADAMAQSRSSGGYARPGSGYGRTPSFGGSRAAPRTPSVSGGYSRPSLPGGGSARRPSVGSGSAWDRSYSRERSSEALDRLRRQSQPSQLPPAQPPLRPAPSAPADSGWWRRGGTVGGGTMGGGTMGGGWPAPRGVPGGWGGGFGVPGQRSFGVWDGVLLWFLLNNLGRAGSTDFFHNHQDDPGYREWRREAEQRAQTDAQTRARLDELDRRLSERQGQPRDPNAPPPEVPPDISTAPRPDVRTPSTSAPLPSPSSPPAEAGSAGGLSSLGLLAILGGGGALFLLARRRRQAAVPSSVTTQGATRPTPDIRSAAPRFRVGMTVTCDPTPFLLGSGALQVPVPAFVEGNTQVSIQAVGRIREGAEELVRLYLPDGSGFFQLHADAAGQIEECRYFGLLDEVVPADEAEWGAWLDPQQGMIGWPEFQTRNGKLYARIWAPGDRPVPPRVMTEAIESLDGTRQIQSRAMLYAAPTDIAAPGPQTEYILVSAQEEGGRAWIEIRAGIDINPASLSLV
ncbi:DUF2491 family protein [Belnapia rosea]|uniref:DUF2491 family protein n=1 Tax=Belnapia rosea TaxID=938405 RepID=UPI00088E2CFF|nr:DUF2491 family protein [Belnapia rosea]SDB15576.1 Protein of unknown function [Belnapia rosea]